ncbi:MAG TPA: DUF3291 domain-containing protein [Actinomycetota bacterium]
MDEQRYHLAQFNIGRILAPTDSPQLADFMALLEPINQLADASPGFVWRLQTADGDATALRPYADDRMLINMSVWESLEAMRNFVYSSRHLDPLRRRREWFERMTDHILVLWWVSAGHIPTVDEAKERLELLRRDGPGPEAFTFKEPYPDPRTLAGSERSLRG